MGKWIYFQCCIVVCLIFIKINHVQTEKNNSCACGTSVNGGQLQRIVGGVEAIPNEFPWVAAIKVLTMLYCGGSLITQSHVLTAAHCISWNSNPSGLTVLLGLHDARNIENVVIKNVKGTIVHEDYNDELVASHDIGIVLLMDPVMYSDIIQPICLPNQGENYDEKLVMLSGWGKLKELGEVSEVLMKVNLRVMPLEKCMTIKPLAKHLTEGMLCASESGKDGCQGDSGGPLIFERSPGKWEQIGIVSWGYGCAVEGVPGVYTDVSNYVPWIEKVLEDELLCTA